MSSSDKNVTPKIPPQVFTEADSGRKGEILAAAAVVFAEHGYAGGSMRDIARVVGVSEPALYRHFPGKEALFIALMRLVARRVHSEAFALIDSMQADTLRAQLLDAFSSRRRIIELYAPLLKTVFSAVAFNERFMHEYRTVVIEPIKARLTEKAAELDAAFGTPNADATRPWRVRALMALFVGFFLTAAVLGDEPEEAIADATIRVMGW